MDSVLERCKNYANINCKYPHYGNTAAGNTLDRSHSVLCSQFKYHQPSHNSQLIPSCLKNNTNRQSWGTFPKNIFYFLQHFVSKPEFNSDLFYFLKVSFPFTAAKSCVTQTTKGRGITFIPHSHLSRFSGDVRDHPPGPDLVRHQARHRPADLRDHHPPSFQETQPGKYEL